MYRGSDPSIFSHMTKGVLSYLLFSHVTKLITCRTDVMHLPLVLDIKEAVDYFKNHNNLNDAQISYLVGFLAREGKSNREIRTLLGIPKVYTVTHYKRAGTLLSDDELNLWSKNSGRITLGHVRMVANMPRTEREVLLRGLLAKKKSVLELGRLAKGHRSEVDVDIKLFSIRMSESIGRPVDITFDKQTKKGKLVLGFFSLDDLEALTTLLGFAGLKED